MPRLVLAALCAAFSFCASAPAVTARAPFVLDAGLCWYETKTCKSIQYGARTIDACKDGWQARCREVELERYVREGCTFVRLSDPTKIAVACGGAK
jgi:hypothetical protein